MTTTPFKHTTLNYLANEFVFLGIRFVYDFLNNCNHTVNNTIQIGTINTAQ